MKEITNERIFFKLVEISNELGLIKWFIVIFGVVTVASLIKLLTL